MTVTYRGQVYVVTTEAEVIALCEWLRRAA